MKIVGLGWGKEKKVDNLSDFPSKMSFEEDTGSSLEFIHALL